MSGQTEGFSGWAILEIMGHRKLGGMVQVSPPEMPTMVRVDVFRDGDEAVATQYYGTQSIFCLTPCSEEVARGLGRASVVRPVTPYELEAPAPRPSRGYSPALDSDDEGRWDYDEDDE